MPTRLHAGPVGPIAVLCVTEGVVLGHLFGLDRRALLVEIVLAAAIGVVCAFALPKWLAIDSPGCLFNLLPLPLLQLLEWFSILLATRFGGPELFYMKGLETFSLAARVLMVLVVGVFWSLLLCIPAALAFGWVLQSAKEQAHFTLGSAARLPVAVAAWRNAAVVCAASAVFVRTPVGGLMAAVASAACIASVLLTLWAFAQARRGEQRQVVEEVIESGDESNYRAAAARVVERTRIETLPPDEATVRFLRRSLWRGTAMSAIVVLAGAAGRC